MKESGSMSRGRVWRDSEGVQERARGAVFSAELALMSADACGLVDSVGSGSPSDVLCGLPGLPGLLLRFPMALPCELPKVSVPKAPVPIEVSAFFCTVSCWDSLIANSISSSSWELVRLVVYPADPEASEASFSAFSPSSGESLVASSCALDPLLELEV